MSRPVVKRDALEQAALHLFASQGVEGTTTKEIASRAGASEGAMFRHWPTKEALAWDLFDRHLRLFVSQLDADVAGAAPSGLRDALRAFVHRCYHLYETDPTLGTYLLLGEHSAARRLPPGYRTPVDVLLDLIRDAQARDQVRPADPVFLGALLFGAILRVPLFKYRGRLEGDLRSRVDEVVDALLLVLRV